MLTGLLYNKPDDHLQFLGDCINSARNIPNLKWDTFLDHSKKPLPAIPKTTDGPIRSESFGLSDEPVFPTFKTEPVLEMKIQTKLPAIGTDNKLQEDSNDAVDDETMNEIFVKDRMDMSAKENLFKNQTVVFVLGKIMLFYFWKFFFSLNNFLTINKYTIQEVFKISSVHMWYSLC